MSKSPQTRPLGPAHLRPITIEIPTTWSPEQALAVSQEHSDRRPPATQYHCSRRIPNKTILLFDQDGHPVVPTCVPTTRRAQWRSSMPEGHRRRRREACWTATSTAASSPQKDADYQDPAPFIRGSSPPLTRGSSRTGKLRLVRATTG